MSIGGLRERARASATCPSGQRLFRSANKRLERLGAHPAILGMRYGTDHKIVTPAVEPGHRKSIFALDLGGVGGRVGNIHLVVNSRSRLASAQVARTSPGCIGM